MMRDKALHQLLLYSVYFSLIFLMMTGRNFLTTHDDAYFAGCYRDFQSLGQWIVFRYHAWSGRVAIEAVLPLVLQANVWIWRCLSVAAFLLMLHSMLALAAGDKKTSSLRNFWLVGMFALFMVFISKRDVLEFGMFWATGSMNYLWPAACLFFALIPDAHLLSGRQAQPARWLISLPPACYASFQEQTSLILICFAFFALCRYRFSSGRFSPWGTLLLCLAVLNFLILVTAPGNYARLQEEALRFYPHFSSTSFWHKAVHGVNYTLLNHWLYDSYKHLLAISLLTCLLFVRKNRSRAGRLLAFFPLGYVLLCIVMARGLKGPFAHAFNLNIYGTISERTASLPVTLHLAPLVLGCLVLVSLPVLWARIFALQATFQKLLLLYLGAIFASYMMSFSPTVFASGYRVFFVPDMLMIVVATLLFCEGLDHFDPRSRPFMVCYALLALAGLGRIISAIG